MMSGLVLEINAEMGIWTCDPILAALLNLWFIMDISAAHVFPRDISLVDNYLN